MNKEPTYSHQFAAHLLLGNNAISMNEAMLKAIDYTPKSGITLKFEQGTLYIAKNGNIHLTSISNRHCLDLQQEQIDDLNAFVRDLFLIDGSFTSIVLIAKTTLKNARGMVPLCFRHHNPKKQ